MFKKIKILFFVAVFFLAGLAIGRWGLGQPRSSAEPLTSEDSYQELRSGGYKFINPLLECEITSAEMVSVSDIQSKVAKLVETKLANNSASNISVYFRDLNNGPWFGLNEKEKFSPASLLKIPVLIAFLKKAESDPQILKQEITFSGFSADNQDPASYFPPGQKIEVGKTYSVEDLLNRMIVYSDNDAKNLLVDNIDPNFMNQVYEDSGIQLPTVQTGDYINVRDYASIFRILFNASYLERQMSEYALELLSKSEFKEGLVAGISAKIEVAHKFGERIITSADGSGISQLHDCGIIYYPGHPYLLCVMTRGKMFNGLAGIIKDISGLVYKEVDDRYGTN